MVIEGLYQKGTVAQFKTKVLCGSLAVLMHLTVILYFVLLTNTDRHELATFSCTTGGRHAYRSRAGDSTIPSWAGRHASLTVLRYLVLYSKVR